MLFHPPYGRSPAPACVSSIFFVFFFALGHGGSLQGCGGHHHSVSLAVRCPCRQQACRAPLIPVGSADPHPARFPLCCRDGGRRRRRRGDVCGLRLGMQLRVGSTSSCWGGGRTDGQAIRMWGSGKISARHPPECGLNRGLLLPVGSGVGEKVREEEVWVWVGGEVCVSLPGRDAAVTVARDHLFTDSHRYNSLCRTRIRLSQTLFC